MNIQHKVTKTTSVQVPFVEGIAHASIEAMMDEVVGGGEIVGHVAEKHTDVVFEKMTNTLTQPLLIQTKIMTLDKIYNRS